MVMNEVIGYRQFHLLVLFDLVVYAAYSFLSDRLGGTLLFSRSFFSEAEKGKETRPFSPLSLSLSFRNKVSVSPVFINACIDESLEETASKVSFFLAIRICRREVFPVFVPEILESRTRSEKRERYFFLKSAFRVLLFRLHHNFCDPIMESD